MLNWQRLSNGNLFAETGPNSGYFIAYRGNSFKLDYMYKLNRYHDWIPLGSGVNEAACKGKATKRDNKEKGNG